MQTEMPFFDSPEEALKSAVNALGGTKEVGLQLFPDKSADVASRHLNDCLNNSRAEKLDLSQILWILRKAKEKGHHTAFAWFANYVGYEAKPIAKAEEVEKLQDTIRDATKTLQFALLTLNKIQDSGKVTS